MEGGPNHHRHAHNMRSWKEWRDNSVIDEQMEEDVVAE
jgi:hypothetical protein